MSNFDPDFRYFGSATGYRNCMTDHEAKFRAFKDYVCDGTKSTKFTDSFVIQFVCHPNFEAHRKTITCFSFNPSSGEFDHESNGFPGGYKRANSFKNYKSSDGHPKGLFYEVNLYTFDGVSSHHASRASGSIYSRKSEHDQSHGKTRGRHWLE